MDRFVVRESRVGTGSSEYPQGNQMMAFAANNGGTNNMVRETIYLSGPFAPEYTNVRVNPTMNATHMPHNVNPQMVHMQTYGHNNVNAQWCRSSLTTRVATTRLAAGGATGAAPRPARRRDGLQTVQMSGLLMGQGHVSGIDPRYLAGYGENGTTYVMGGQQVQRNPTPVNYNSYGEYQNRSFAASDRNKPKTFMPHVASNIGKMPQNSYQTVTPDTKNAQETRNVNTQPLQNTMPLVKKPNELDLSRNDTQNQVVTRADKFKELNKSGPRAFSGPIEKVLKWHKSLQDIGIFIFYEIVAKCVSIRPGDGCAKNLVVRDDNGPAMQVVYYEVDFMLPELKPPCTIRAIGRMVAGTNRLHAFKVRPATGDDVATLPRRAAVTSHHVAKLCNQYGHST